MLLWILLDVVSVKRFEVYWYNIAHDGFHQRLRLFDLDVVEVVRVLLTLDVGHLFLERLVLPFEFLDHHVETR